ncbi:MAG: diguanylate cyclase [Gemmatimonadaceae bacterium]|jgi:diguanylate cyclase (GGDEF)-like protein|nr:diguanylate cyclase [Gemmatimonadaceae bacterium]
MTEPVITEDTAVLVSDGAAPPGWLSAWLDASGLSVCASADSQTIRTWALRSRPRVIIVDARREPEERERLALVTQLKADAWMALIPLVAIGESRLTAALFEAGADEVLAPDAGAPEATARLAALLRRSDRDTDVHPSTRLPGARGIEAELARRLAGHEPFAACYADLDHFKEYNDRYGFHRGNAVIGLVARVLHDAVTGLCGSDGFVGHIGGDDFLYIVPTAAMERVCDEIVKVFDELAPLQYSEADRRAGYFLGKDRRNQLYRVPLMTLSIGVVTNQRRRFSRPADVSELATEMKSYAKTLSGSVWTLDRRRDDLASVGSASLSLRPVRESADVSVTDARRSENETPVLPLRSREAR